MSDILYIYIYYTYFQFYFKNISSKLAFKINVVHNECYYNLCSFNTFIFHSCPVLNTIICSWYFLWSEGELKYMFSVNIEVFFFFFFFYIISEYNNKNNNNNMHLLLIIICINNNMHSLCFFPLNKQIIFL